MLKIHVQVQDVATEKKYLKVLADVPRAFIGDEQVAADNVVADCIFLGNLSVIH